MVCDGIGGHMISYSSASIVFHCIPKDAYIDYYTGSGGPPVVTPSVVDVIMAIWKWLRNLFNR